jgi:hypothetical protein
MDLYCEEDVVVARTAEAVTAAGMARAGAVTAAGLARAEALWGGCLEEAATVLVLYFLADGILKVTREDGIVSKEILVNKGRRVKAPKGKLRGQEGENSGK